MRCKLGVIFCLWIISFHAFGQKPKFDSAYYFIARADSLNWYGKYAEMTDYCYKALSWAERNKNCCGVIRSYSLLARIKYGLRDVTTAIALFRKANRMNDSCSCNQVKHKVVCNLGVMMFEYYDKKSKHQDTAVNLLLKALELTKEHGSYNELSKTHSLLSEVFMVLNRNEEQIPFHIQQALHYAELANDTAYLAFAEIKMGKYLQQKGQLASAEIHFARALQLHRLVQNPENIAMSLVNMASILNAQGKPGVYEYLIERNTIKDSIFNQSTREQIADLTVQYQLEKKEREKQLALKEKEIQEAKLKSNTRTIYALILTLVLVVVIVFWRVNAMRLRRRQMELEAKNQLQAEKERISRDLHDNVGGQLTYVLYALEDLANEKNNSHQPVLEGVNASVRSVIGNLRETIWAINDSEINCNDFADKLKLYSRNMFKYTEVKLIFHEDMKVQKTLNSIVGLNMFRIAQEALNNVFKHANAKEVIVEMKASTKWEVKITDNGKGFDAKASYSNYGLANMKKRATEANLVLEIESWKDKGTTIRVIG